MKWQTWASREGVDLTTMEYVDNAFFELIAGYTHKHSENFFTTLKGKIFTHWTKIDMLEVGRFYYRRYFLKPGQIKRYYLESLNDLKRNESEASRYRRRISKVSDSKILVEALRKFSKNFAKFNFKYSILPFISLEAWQKDFENVIFPIFEKINNREKMLIIKSLSRPWRQTYAMQLPSKVRHGITKKVLKQSEFLRSWSIIWYDKIDSLWLNSFIKKREARNRSFDKDRTITKKI